MHNLPEFKNRSTILIVPLNWGLGHATRLIPIVKHFEKKHKIILAGNKPSISVLMNHFPYLENVLLPEQNFTFDKHFFSPLHLFNFFSLLNKTIKSDKKIINTIVEKYNIDIIISDNRYGIIHNNTRNILITHQLMLKIPHHLSIFEKQVHKIVIKKIQKFDECWIPDLQDKYHNLSGDLSHKYPLPENARFIGILSRFCNYLQVNTENTLKKVLLILSGPEPQRTIFENNMTDFFIEKKIPATILQAKPDSKKQITNQTLTKLPHCNDKEFINLLNTHSIIVSRAGYSSIMDFYCLKKNIILVPTPKQTEQLYLSHHLHRNKLFTFVEETNIRDFLLTELGYSR